MSRLPPSSTRTDTTFPSPTLFRSAVLGGAAEFTALCELTPGVDLAAVEKDLRTLPGLARQAHAKISVTPFGFDTVHSDSARITHRIEIVGEDSPGDRKRTRLNSSH